MNLVRSILLPAIVAAPFNRIAFVIVLGVDWQPEDITVRWLITAEAVLGTINVLGYLVFVFPSVRYLRKRISKKPILAALIMLIGMCGGGAVGSVLIAPIVLVSWNAGILATAASTGALAGSISTAIWLLLNMDRVRPSC